MLSAKGTTELKTGEKCVCGWGGQNKLYKNAITKPVTLCAN